MSTRETIIAAVASILVAGNVASGRVYRSRREQIGTVPAVVVEPSGATADEPVLGAIDHELTIAVSVYAKGDTPDGAADDTLLAVHAALMADLSLGLGNTNGVQLNPRFEYDPDFEDYDHVRAVHRYRVTYRTVATSF